MNLGSMYGQNTGSNQGVLQYDGKYGKAKLDKWPFTKRFTGLRNEAMTWYPAWKELTQFHNPTRGFFMDDVPNRGKKIDHRIVLDGQPRRAIRTLASGMMSGLTSPSRPWVKPEFEDQALNEYEPVATWLDLLERAMMGIYQRSNLYAIFYMMYEEIATVGTACSFVLPDFWSILRGRSYTIGEYFLGCGPDGRVNAIAREFWMTAVQIIMEFGYANCTPQVQNAYREHNTETFYKVNHLIEMNDDRIPGFKDFQNMQYRSLYWEAASPADVYLRLGGYDNFPVIAPRWARTTTADIYGRGPGWDSLGDAKMLQKEQRSKLTALDKVVDPPLQADSSVEGEVNRLPGGVTRFSAQLPNAGVKPTYQISPDLGAIREDIIEVKKAISDSFFESLFLGLINMRMEKSPRMTAYEVAELQAEKLLVLGPLLESLEHEMLTPANDIVAMTAVTRGLVPPPPKEIQGMELKFKYVSVLAQAQRMAGLTSVDQWRSGVEQSVQIRPDVVDIVNYDEVNLGKADMLAIPAKFKNSPATMSAIRKQRAQQQAVQAKLQAAESIAKATKDGGAGIASAASAPLGENSALDALLAGVTGGK